MGTEAFRAEIDQEVDYILDNLMFHIENNPRVFQDEQNVKQRIG